MAEYMGEYKIIRRMDGGGNANVFVAENARGEEVAIKILREESGNGKKAVKRNRKKRIRFKIETEMVVGIQDEIKGVIPIFSYGLPDEKIKKYWYAMPIAIPLEDKLKEVKSLEDKVNCVLELARTLEKSNYSEWKYLQNRLFPKTVPLHAEWRDIDSIIKILNDIGSMPGLNHMFFPTGGGQDVESAKYANEEGCICLVAGGCNYIFKPYRLELENYGKRDYRWSYFRLQLEPIEPIHLLKLNFIRRIPHWANNRMQSFF